MTKIRAEWRPRMRVHWFSGPYVAESVRQIPPHREGHIRVPYFYLGYYLRSIYNFEIDLLVRAAHTRLVPCISRGRGGGPSGRPAATILMYILNRCSSCEQERRCIISPFDVLRAGAAERYSPDPSRGRVVGKFGRLDRRFAKNRLFCSADSAYPRISILNDFRILRDTI